MSVQATSWVIKHSKHKGSALLLLIMISNHAHADGTNAFPSVRTLAEECRMSQRQVIRLIAELERSGELLVTRSTGRVAHKFSVVMELNPDKLSGMNTDKMSGLNASNPDKSNKPTLTNSTPNPDTQGACYKEEPLNRKIEKRGGGKAAAPAPGHHHVAVTIYRKVTGYFPHRDLYQTVVERLGDEPDEEKLAKVWLEWIGGGRNRMNTIGILDWYEFGIPELRTPAHSRNGGEPAYFKGLAVEPEDVPFEEFVEAPLRPPPPLTDRETAAWRSVLAIVEKKLNRDVFNTWFKAVIFDGTRTEGQATVLMLRAGRVTHDWINKYYAELLAEAIGSVQGEGEEFRIAWEVEEPVQIKAAAGPQEAAP